MIRHAVYVEEKGYVYKDEINKDDLNRIVEMFNLEEKNVGDTYTYFKLDSSDSVIIKSFLIDDKNALHIVLFDEINPLNLIKENIFINTLEDVENLKREVEENFNYDDAEEFLKNRQDRSIKDIAYLLLKGEKVTIVDKVENHNKWLEAIYYCFNEASSKNITFTTNPYFKGDVRLYIFDENIQKSSYTFDFKRGIGPKLMINTPYVKFIDSGVYASKKIYRTYMNFMEYFNYTLLDEELNNSYNLFLLLNVPNLINDGVAIKEALKFLLKYIKPEERQAFIENYINSLDLLWDKVNSDIAEEFYLFMFKDIEHKKGIYDRIVSIFYRSYFNILKEIVGFDSAVELFERMLELNKEKPYFKTYVLDKTFFKFVEDFVDLDVANEISLYIAVSCAVSSGLSYIQLKNIEGFNKTLTQGISDRIIKYILDKIEGDLDFAIGFIIDVEGILEAHIIRNKLYEIYKRESSEVKRSIYKRLIEADKKELSFEIFKRGLEESEDAVKYFEEYRREILDYFMEYSKEYLGKIINEYFKSLNRQDRFQEAKKLLFEYIINTSYTINKEAECSIVQNFELGITLENYLENKELIEQVRAIKARKEIKTRIDMSFLDVIYLIDDFSGEDFGELIDEIKYVIKEYDIETSIRHRNIILYKVGKYLTNFEYHKALFDLFYEEEDILTYFEFIKINRREESYKDILSSFIVYYLYYIEPKYRLLNREDKNTEIEDAIINELTTFKSKDLDYFDEKIKETFQNLHLSIPVKWSIILNNTKQRMTLKYKILNLFKG
ncbi:hypothetical protein [Caloramator sp. ALD01]|uniref:hypothetical protein n=1 Tax=Caloramator sp. ALD01 TaxID=1031288 RepID=UPI0004246B31|nr:hypothetical protein [Caloramator sp. ALD01]